MHDTRRRAFALIEVMVTVVCERRLSDWRRSSEDHGGRLGVHARRRAHRQHKATGSSQLGAGRPLPRTERIWQRNEHRLHGGEGASAACDWGQRAARQRREVGRPERRSLLSGRG